MLASRGIPSVGAAVIVLVGLAILLADGDGERPGEGSARRADEADGRVVATVTRAIDGDTVEAALASGEEDIRYIGVDTPESVAPGEPVECFGKRAAGFNRELVEGRRVRLVFDDERRDRYGRLLAYVYAGQTFVNAQLVRRGYARTLAIEPNTDRAALFDRLEQSAGNAGRGLWGACGP